jgi:hypothetical protein
MIDDDISNFGPANIQAMDRLEVVKVRDDRLSNEGKKKVIQTPLFFHLQDYPHIAKFIQAVNQRPNLSGYFASLKN